MRSITSIVGAPRVHFTLKYFKATQLGELFISLVDYIIVKGGNQDIQQKKLLRLSSGTILSQYLLLCRVLYY